MSSSGASVLQTLKIVGVSVGIGLIAGSLWVAGFSGFISGVFSSHTYTTVAQSHRYIFGVALGYGVMFAVASAFDIFYLRRLVRTFYPLLGAVTAYIAIFWRTIGDGLSHLDCGTDCASNIAPQSADDAAVHWATLTLVGVYVLFCCIYGVMSYRERMKKTPSAKK